MNTCTEYPTHIPPSKLKLNFFSWNRIPTCLSGRRLESSIILSTSRERVKILQQTALDVRQIRHVQYKHQTHHSGRLQLHRKSQWIASTVHKLHIEAESQVVGDKNFVLRDCAGMLLLYRHSTMLNVLSCTTLLLTSCSEQMTCLANPHLLFYPLCSLCATRITVHAKNVHRSKCIYSQNVLVPVG